MGTHYLLILRHDGSDDFQVESCPGFDIVAAAEHLLNLAEGAGQHDHAEEEGAQP